MLKMNPNHLVYSPWAFPKLSREMLAFVLQPLGYFLGYLMASLKAVGVFHEASMMLSVAFRKLFCLHIADSRGNQTFSDVLGLGCSGLDWIGLGAP